MELESCNFRSKDPHGAREPQIADPCTMLLYYGYLIGMVIYNNNVPMY
jgi:hypothetical protein